MSIKYNKTTTICIFSTKSGAVIKIIYIYNMPLGKTRSKRQRGSGASIPTLNDANLGEQLRNAIRTESIKQIGGAREVQRRRVGESPALATPGPI